MKEKRFSQLLSHRLRRRSRDTRELAAQLAPLEELKSKEDKRTVATQEDGVIVIGRDQATLAKEVMETEAPKNVLRLEPVVIVIVGLLLAFIAFIAWQVSRMPLPK